MDGITENARASLRDEPGCLIFDVHRDNTIPTRSTSMRSTPTRTPSPSPTAAHPVTRGGNKWPLTASSTAGTATPSPHQSTSVPPMCDHFGQNDALMRTSGSNMRKCGQ
ncbi:putative quinol monooxygenase [Rhodococcus koreensis]